MLTVTVGSPGKRRLAVRDSQPDALRDGGRAVQTAARHHHGELVAAVARADVEDAHRSPQDVGDVLDDRVASQVPEAIVDHLERVDVDDLQRQRGALPGRALQFLLQATLEIGPVEETACRIDDRRLRQTVRALLGSQASQRQCGWRHQRAERA